MRHFLRLVVAVAVGVALMAPAAEAAAPQSGSLGGVPSDPSDAASSLEGEDSIVLVVEQTVVPAALNRQAACNSPAADASASSYDHRSGLAPTRPTDTASGCSDYVYDTAAVERVEEHATASAESVILKAFAGDDDAAAPAAKVADAGTTPAGSLVTPRSVADDLVLDDFVVVRGGTSDVPPPGEIFSGAAGRTVDDAAAGVPHGQIRATTAGEIRAGGGSVQHAPELTRSGVLNEPHVNVCLGTGPCPFGPLQPNPVPKPGRIQ